MSDGESVYDYCWYPYMSSSSMLVVLLSVVMLMMIRKKLTTVGFNDPGPETCVFASTTRDHPIHLWDATTGQVHHRL